MFGRVLLFCFLVLAFDQSLFSRPGDLDPTFGTGGFVKYRFNDREDSFQAVAIQSDGKIVVAGKTGNGRSFVFRYTSAGQLDTSFAGTGMLNLSLSGTSESMLIQPDGKIVVSGVIGVFGANSAFWVFRVMPNGSLDTTFDGDGFATIDITNAEDVGFAVDLQSDGKLVIAGVVGGLADNQGRIGVVRLNSNGSLDATFDNDGIVVTQIGTQVQKGYGMKIQGDGRIVVSASSEEFDSLLLQRDLVVVRYLSNGSLDPTFGSGGIATTDLNGLKFLFGDLEIQTDGRILVLGSVGINTTFQYAFTVFRFLPDGSPDLSFGNGGKTVIDAGNTNSAQALEIQTDGKIIAVGHSWTGSAGLDILAARLNSNGGFDSTFGTGGKVYRPVGTSSDYGWDAKLAPDGNLLIAGDYTVSFIDWDAVLFRLLCGNAAPVATGFDFDGDGKADRSVFRPSDRVWYLDRTEAGFYAVQFGLTTDRIVPADYDGDGKFDIAVFRNGIWYVLRTSDSIVSVYSFGIAGDLPTPGDYSGDGRAEIAVYRTGTWWILDPAVDQVTTHQFGLATDKPVPADYDGDGKFDLAVYRSGEWHLNRSSLGYLSFNFGLAIDRPVVADYDGDGKSDPAVFRAGVWYVRGGAGTVAAFHFGLADDLPVPADYDGDGKADAAVYRSGTWYLLQTTAGFSVSQFGLSGDTPTPSAYIPLN